jgi:uncharacterized membrane protein YccF (DUF307 family)
MQGAQMTRDDYLPATTNDRSVIAPAQVRDQLWPAAPPVSVPQQFVSPTPTVNVNVTTPMMPMIVTASAGPSMIVRILWYVFIGWWLSALVIVLGYALMLTVIGIPVAFALFNRIPQALTLRARTVRYGSEVRDGITYLTAGSERQRPWYWRVPYFLLIGWWFGAVWLVAAWLIGLFIITLPITFLMYNRTSAVMTLQRH